MYKKWFISFIPLTLIVFLALCIRLLFIDTMPYGAHIDEASLGYNAYSIAKTGKDEFGKTLPLIFQAYGDQKLPAYIYAIAPFTKLFGLSNLAVRLPGAIAGSLLVIFIYLLLRQFKFSHGVSLLGALIAATSPWLIMLSRVFGYESGFGLLFFTIGLWASLSSVHCKHTWRYILIATCTFALTWYSYIAYRVITTSMLVVFVIVFMRSKRFISSRAVLLLLLFSMLVVPLVVLSRSGTGTARIGHAVATSMQGVVMTIDDDRSICARSLPRILCYVNSNKIKAYADTVVRGYAEALAPPYLFFTGDIGAEYVNVDGHGLLSLAVLPFYLLGLMYLGSRLLSRTLTRYELFIILGLLITPIPTIVFATLQKVRLSGLFPFVLITCMYGAQYLLSFLKVNWHRKAVLFVSTAITLVLTTTFMIDFLAIHVPKHEIAFQTPVARLMKYLGTHDKKTPVYIRSINEAVVLYAYYNAVDPQFFQDNVVRPTVDSGGFSHATDLGNIHRTDKNIDEIYCATMNYPQVLFATNANLMKEKMVTKPTMVIYSRDNVHDLYYVYDTKDVLKKNIDCEYFRSKK